MNFFKLSFLFSLLFLTSCDDGDILISEFNFDSEDDIEFCSSEESDDTVFFNYNPDNSEVIFVRINGEYDGEEEDSETFNIAADGSISNSQAEVRYINFEDDIDDINDFFCTAVASNEPINRESQGIEGTVTITTLINTLSTEDNDGDGLTNEEEGFGDGTQQDTDGDTIPDYLDEDDDNDNVKTEDELDDSNEIMDTDNDGTPDHLDDDDDNDGVLTRFEVSEINNTPRNPNNVDDGVFFYLDNEVSDQIFMADITIANSFNTGFETIVQLNNLTLTSDGEGTSTFIDTLTIGTNTDENNDTTQTVTITIDGTTSVLLNSDNEEDSDL